MGKIFVAVTSIETLRAGDMVKHAIGGIAGGDTMIVTANHGSYVTAVVTAHVSNPGEWLVLRGESGR